MAKILFVWELGGGLGHMARALPIARSLRERGHELLFALKDLSRAETLLGRAGFTSLQAPLWLPSIAGVPAAANYAEILFRAGFLDANGLIGLVKGWRALFDLVRPELVLIDHAPTALLAVRGLTFRKVLIGNGFFAPPRVAPMPAFRTWQKIEPRRLLESEARALHVANEVLQRLNAPPLSILADLFDVDENILDTWPELDHYPQRGVAHYWGPAFALDAGVPAQWPAGEGKQVFAYLKSDYRYLDAVLQALRAAPCRALVFLAGASTALIKKHQSGTLAIVSEPVNMDSARRAADVIVCHAGIGTAAASLLAGKPLLLLPIFSEGYTLGDRVAQLGAGINVPYLDKAPDYKKPLLRLLKEPGFTEKAQAFAHKYRDFSHARQIEETIARIEEILASVTSHR
jgi:UDP:flavonoid glycosyltransferase YjiC (YdhE family)